MDNAHQQINYYDGSQQHPEPSHSTDGQRQRRHSHSTHASPTHSSVNHGLVVDGGHSGRAHLKSIALTTIEAINNGLVDVTKAINRTRFYSPRSPELVNWREARATTSWYKSRPSKILIAPMTTIEGTRCLHNSHPTRRLAILNFASPTRPGGGFLEGASAQEESIARSSSLYFSLCSEAARPFYALHAQDDKGGFYSHAMIYSRNIHLVRDDAGAWIAPFQVDVLTSPAVNAGKARKVYYTTPRNQLENAIREHMSERIARVLALFEREGARNLVLGSFGTGVFRNDIETMAVIWCELLLGPSARFASSFENIVFAIPDRHTRRCFESIFCLGQRRNQ
ncbi:hypothetical protein D9613_000177 [Agrocybe pediades]|uniref:Microbial-type PARG catalytic domain-containing protein n=1 Tax=Agrocybe pediades TaxID=84607 RepID=A0A8H4R265_9AGAR|nr:hypothetical protein D9613_000177 [Agrocybe pediades]